MSHDQRPVKVRVVATPAQASRRSEDGPPPAGTSLQAAAHVQDGLAAPAKPARRLVPLMFYVLACAGGGFGAVVLARGLGGL